MKAVLPQLQPKVTREVLKLGEENLQITTILYYIYQVSLRRNNGETVEFVANYKPNDPPTGLEPRQREAYLDTELKEIAGEGVCSTEGKPVSSAARMGYWFRWYQSQQPQFHYALRFDVPPELPHWETRPATENWNPIKDNLEGEQIEVYRRDLSPAEQEELLRTLSGESR